MDATNMNIYPVFSESELEREEWLPVVEWQGIYSVSNIGRVRRDEGRTAGGILKSTPDGWGYLRVKLCLGGFIKFKYVHRLVAASFMGECPEGKTVNHENGNKTDNRVTNLNYMTHTEQLEHSYRMGLRKPTQGENHGRAKIKANDIPLIFQLWKDGLSQREIGRTVGLTGSHISKILNGKRWLVPATKNSKVPAGRPQG